ncbi:DUF885 family protein [Glaciecola sp. XM2]|uniref:DUF885 domain-containing protein n=1 Tax=Glaciecola sp. XM2 TaxID=1914931 RepID=UPI001BDF0E07|nr:DUF885 domain-containing protein [Glaciecola sp. XM2]MBT1449911.1 DUF885 family protein [Glaciecola sp. XM2]
MIRNPIVLLPSLFVGLALFACSPAPKKGDGASESEASGTSLVQTEAQRLAQFFADSYQRDLELSPMRQSRLGLKWDYDKWDDASPEALQANRELLEQRLAQSNTFDIAQLNEQEQSSLRLYQEDITRKLANDEFRFHSYILNQFRGPHTSVPSFLINIHKVSSVEDAQAYIARLNGVKPYFDQIIEQLKLREEAGIFPPRWAYDQMIQASANVINGNPFSEGREDSTIYADFVSKLDALGLSNSEKGGLLADARQALTQSVLPAYRALMTELARQQELSPPGDGVWRLPNGDKWYENRLSWYTTTDLTAQQVHDLGLEHVQRIHGLMRDIMTQVNFEGDLQAFFKFMREDPQFYYENTEEGRQRYLTEAKAYIDVMEEKLPEYFGLVPKADMIVKRVEPFREQSAGKAFYQSPARDGSRPGTYFANLFDMNSMPIYQMEALAYHEGIPGHHMQRAIAQELEGIPEFQKYVSFTVYTEGWGLYTETLAKDMGFYADPYSDFGRLAMELWRACRLVVDTGLHSMQWSRQEAIDYLIANTPNPQNDAVKAIERYIALPGQATAYTIGKLKILELRAQAKEALGDNFSYAGFHDEVLKHGPLPLNMLEEKIDAWVARESAPNA